MGQANRRGSFEQRVEQAQARDRMLLVKLNEAPSHKQTSPLHKAVKRYGVRRVSSRMAALGLIAKVIVATIPQPNESQNTH